MGVPHHVSAPNDVPDPSTPVIPGYNLAPLTPGDAVAFLARGVGADRAAALWMRACADAQVPSNARSPRELIAVAERLAREQGVAGVIASSLLVRLQAYRLLAEKQARAEGRDG
jgi:hypothetical protein